MLVEVEGHCAQGLSTVLNAGELDDDGHDEDDEEERVVEEVGKYVDLGWFQFAGVDLVEDLKENESVEEEAVMATSCVVPVFDSNGRLDAE